MSLARLLATWFGAGLLKPAPGSWGSLAALPFAWIFVKLGGAPLLAAAALLVFLIGCWAAERVIREDGVEDPGFIVIDEVAGQWLVLLPAALEWRSYLAGLLLFRLFDIWKPWPVRWADRNVKGGFGVMLDDVVAALYGVVLMLVLRHFRVFG